MQSSNKHKYSPLKIAQLKMWMEEMKAQGQTKYFEVYVDDFKIVPKTDNIQNLESFEPYMDEETETVKIFIYNTPDSNRYTQKIFTLKEKEKESAQNQPQQNQTLSGAEVTNIVSEKVTQAKKEWDCEKVKEKLEETKGKLSEAEDYIEKLKGIISETEKKLQEAKSLGDFTSVLKDLAPQILSIKKEEKGNLSGAKTETEKKPEAEASFKAKSSGEGNSAEENDKTLIEFAKSFRENFNKEELEMILSVIDEFVKDKSNIKPVAELLNINIKQQNTK
ncbi:MAG: hypothetical protein HY063_10960 [Bacteroidetes bacterium]|nr:hypothetical protein [Bacteroidota bacterium]